MLPIVVVVGILVGAVMVCDFVEELPRKVESPLYVAVIVLVPALEELSPHSPLPEANVIVHEVDPSETITTPVGVPPPTLVAPTLTDTV